LKKGRGKKEKEKGLKGWTLLSLKREFKKGLEKNGRKRRINSGATTCINKKGKIREPQEKKAKAEGNVRAGHCGGPASTTFWEKKD